MKLKVKITNIETTNELHHYWQNEDYIKLLEELNYPDADQGNPDELRDLLFMAITDFEPAEAAKILLSYKLSDRLSEGQIQNLSHEMIEDKVAEDYPEPALHFDLFNLNQLLFKAYNGTFPNTQATIMMVELSGPEEVLAKLSKEILIKSLQKGLRENSLINRLFEDQLMGKEPFVDAQKVIWEYNRQAGNVFEVITSKYWIEKEDFEQLEFESEIRFFEEDE